MTQLQRILPIALVSLLALGAVARAAEPAGKDMTELYIKASKRAQRGDYPAAIRLYKDILNDDPYSPEAAWNIGELSFMSEAWGDCAYYFRRYLFVLPTADDRGTVLGKLSRCERKIDRPASLEIPPTEPEGVEISINGMALGRGSLEKITLPAGNWKIVATKFDYEPFEQTLEMSGGESRTLQISLQKKIYYGELKIEASEPGASVTIDGRDHGVTPLAATIRMPEGRYLVKLSKEGFHDWQRYIDVPKENVEDVEVRMLPLGKRR